MKNFMITLWLLIIFAISAGAASLFNPSKHVEPPAPIESPKELPPVVIEPDERMALYWENTTEPHPERAPWSDALIGTLKKDFTHFSSAYDWKDICRGFTSLTDAQKLKAMGEFWVAVAYYESSFKPGQESVDVGTKGDKGSWSVGLYQMSANDNAAKAEGVDYLGLKDPVKNIKVAMNQFHRQIKNTNLVLLHKTNKYRYWAVILKDGKYEKIDEIKARVKKQAPFCQ